MQKKQENSSQQNSTFGDFQRRIRVISYISMFTTLMVVGAYIKIPFFFVPLTLQTFFVLLSGNLLGARFGALSQLIYLILGLAGLPIFAFGGGLGYIFQPSFGYLMAYPIAAYISGTLIELIYQYTKKDLHFIKSFFLKIFFANIIGVLFIFIFGVIYLYCDCNFVIGTKISFDGAFFYGFIIFLPGAILKVILVSIVTIRIKKYLIF
jgi:biotin transport system substrate-specific component